MAKFAYVRICGCAFCSSWSGRTSSFEGPPPMLPVAPAPQPAQAPVVPVLKMSRNNTLNRAGSLELKKIGGPRVLSPRTVPDDMNAAWTVTSSSNKHNRAVSPASRVPKPLLSLRNKLRQGNPSNNGSAEGRRPKSNVSSKMRSAHTRKTNSRSKHSQGGGVQQTNWSEVLSKLKSAANTDGSTLRHDASPIVSTDVRHIL